jgi:hypothetical protein
MSSVVSVGIAWGKRTCLNFMRFQMIDYFLAYKTFQYEQDCLPQNVNVHLNNHI